MLPKTDITANLTIPMLLMMALCTASVGKTIYVDDDATGANDGSSWENAYNYLQDAMANANDSEKPVEIRVAKGVYMPDQGANQTLGDQEATFQLINRVTLKGGYAGFGEPDPDDRNVAIYATILSGDLNGGWNSYHVVTGSYTDETAVLDGFIITGGNANGPQLVDEYPGEYRLSRGGGMYNYQSSPTLTDCTFSENSAVSGGGGMYNCDGSSPTLTNCTFSGNSARYGGGMWNLESSPTLANCIFRGNSAINYGGGVWNLESSPILTDCTFSGNSAVSRGGGMDNFYNSSPSLTNCIFSGNSAFYGGAGMYNSLNSSPTLTNCTFSDNSATHDGGGGMCNEDSSPTLTDCTFSRNSSESSLGGGMDNYNSNPNLTKCTFNGNTAGLGGGGLYNDNSNPIMTNCIFSDNEANLKFPFPHTSNDYGGGGMYNKDSNPTLIHCMFIGNSAFYGGGMCNRNVSATLTNCIFSDNKAENGLQPSESYRPDYVGIVPNTGGGMYNNNSNIIITNCTFAQNSAYAGYALACNSVNLNPSNVELINCILWDVNSGGWIFGEIKNYDDSKITATYSNIWDGFSGEGNIDAEPLFADPNNGDYHLKSQGGRWDPNNQSWIIDDVTSPCIDAGDPNSPVGDEPMPNGGRINMGRYGGTSEASMPTIYAYNPNPADGQDNVNINVILSWRTGLNAVSHDVYFGTVFDDANNAGRTNPLDVLVSQGQNSSTYAPAGALESGQTYYWRIDEVDNQGMIIKGVVWSFTTTSGPIKGRACFTGQTGVWVDGKLVPFSNITKGQLINDIVVKNTVEEIQEHSGIFTCYEIMLDSGNCITVAESHYFMAESGQWVSLKELKTGTRLQTAKGSIGIISVAKRSKPYVGKVYNLKVKGSDRYFVGKDAVIVRDY